LTSCFLHNNSKSSTLQLYKLPSWPQSVPYERSNSILPPSSAVFSRRNKGLWAFLFYF
jgi:hypothetical protein